MCDICLVGCMRAHASRTIRGCGAGAEGVVQRVLLLLHLMADQFGVNLQGMVVVVVYVSLYLHTNTCFVGGFGGTTYVPCAYAVKCVFSVLSES